MPEEVGGHQRETLPLKNYVKPNPPAAGYAGEDEGKGEDEGENGSNIFGPHVGKHFELR